MKDIIFETIVSEATKLVESNQRKGMDFDTALAMISEDLNLDEVEKDEVRSRVKKAPKPAPVVQEIQEEVIEETEVPSNSICFLPEDLETAVGVLMYKGIPWTGKTSNTLTFESEELVVKAKEALNRRWNFIESNPRKVAVIEFDNLADYQKVLEFMASKKLHASLVEDFEGLQEDVSLEFETQMSEHKTAIKMAKELGESAPVAPVQNLNYSAVRKDAQVDLSSLNPISETSARVVRISKRWN